MSMAVNELKAGAILSYISIAVNNIVGLLYTPFLLRMLGQTEYGLYSLVASIVGYLTILDLGFGNAIIRYTAKYRAEGKTEEQSALLGMFFRLYCIIGLVAFIAGIILLINAENIFGQTMTPDDIHQTKIMMGLMVFNIAVSFPMSIWGAIITAYERFIFQRLVNIARVILNAIVMILLLMMGFKAIAMVVVLTIFNILTLLSNFWFCKNRLHISIHFSQMDYSLLKEIFSYSIWIFLAGIVDRVYWSTGQFVIGIYHPPTAIAIFGVAIQLQAFYSSFSFAISGVFFPKIVRLTTIEKDVHQLSNLFIRVGRLQFYVMGLVFTGFLLFGQRFVELWAGKEYSSSFIMAVILFSVILLSSIQAIGTNILQALGDVKFRAISIFLVSLGAFIICFPVANRYAGIGCSAVIALGIFIGHILILNWYYSAKIGLNIKTFWLNIAKLAIIPLLLTIIGFYVLKFIDTGNTFSYICAIIIYALIYFISTYFISFNAEERRLFSPILSKLKKISQ